MWSHLVDELDERGPLDLDGVVVAVVEPDHKVEEVGLAQVGRRLLCELYPADVGTAEDNKYRVNHTIRNKLLWTLPS